MYEQFPPEIDARHIDRITKLNEAQKRDAKECLAHDSLTVDGFGKQSAGFRKRST